MKEKHKTGGRGRDPIGAPMRMEGGDGPDRRRNVPLPPSREPRPGKNMMVFFFVVMAMVTFLLLLGGSPTRSSLVPYSTFLVEVTNQRVQSVVIIEREIEFVSRSAHLTNGRPQRGRTYIPYHDPELLKILAEHGVRVEGEEKSGSILSIFLNLLPWVVLIFFVWFLMVRQMQGNNNKALSFGKSRARLIQGNQRRITFKDVAGVEEAKQELVEIIEFLVDPAKFRKLGARIPKGVLLVGPPGTGKTLLARAVAGEANVPFFSISGSDFVEMFVGVGASRVRDLFEQGKKKAPCILFIDELDAVGRSRGAGYGGGHDEREQTLNQMLVEMDGFEANDGLIVIAATNRPDVLDPALLRPGRFDRQVVVDVPDVRGREAILKVHSSEKPVGNEVDLNQVARGTPGFTGADLENMVNEAALLAARRNKKKIGMEELEEAKDKVLMGPERRSLVINETEKQTTAWHEAGHALLGFLLPHADPVHKVTIIPRGRALGLTQSLPVDDRHSYSREFLKDQIALLMGGRVAEELYASGNITNGASNDIERATNLARAMVCEWGMSERLGPLSYGQKEQPIFIGKEIARHKDYSEKVAEQVDAEIRAFVEQGYQRARDLLKRHRKALDALSDELLQREALDGKELEKLLGANGVKRGSGAVAASATRGSSSRALRKGGTTPPGRKR